MNSSRKMQPTLPALREVWAGLSWVELVFVLLSLLMAAGFILEGVDFAKMGIPLALPERLGGITNFAPKIFVTEIYIFFLGLVLLASREGRGNIRAFLAKPMPYRPLFLA